MKYMKYNLFPIFCWTNEFILNIIQCGCPFQFFWYLFLYFSLFLYSVFFLLFLWGILKYSIDFELNLQISSLKMIYWLTSSLISWPSSTSGGCSASRRVGSSTDDHSGCSCCCCYPTSRCSAYAIGCPCSLQNPKIISNYMYIVLCNEVKKCNLLPDMINFCRKMIHLLLLKWI